MERSRFSATPPAAVIRVLDTRRSTPIRRVPTMLRSATPRFTTTRGGNTASGYWSLRENTDGSENTAVGDQALASNTTGRFNSALGYQAGYDLTTGSHNICIGAFVTGVAGESNRIRIADNLPTGAGESACYIGGIAGQTVGAGGTACVVDNNGKLGVFLSARRFKTDIADMGNVSEALLALRPVTFHYKPELDKTGIPRFGLIAEEVAKVNPDLVTHDAKGELSTVRYEAVNAMLLNEFLKEHREVAELKSTVAEQRKGLEAMAAQLKEQAAQIQKVSTGRDEPDCTANGQQSLKLRQGPLARARV